MVFAPHREWSAASQHMQRQRRDGLFDERVRRSNLKRHLSEEEKALSLFFFYSNYICSLTNQRMLYVRCVVLRCLHSAFFLQKAFLFVFIFVVNGCVRSCVVRLCHVMTSWTLLSTIFFLFCSSLVFTGFLFCIASRVKEDDTQARWRVYIALWTLFFLDAGPFWFFPILTWPFFFEFLLPPSAILTVPVSPRWCRAWTQSTYVSFILVGWMLDVRCVLFCLIAFLFLLAMKCPPLSLFFCLFFSTCARSRFFLPTPLFPSNWTSLNCRCKSRGVGGGGGGGGHGQRKINEPFNYSSQA